MEVGGLGGVEVTCGIFLLEIRGGGEYFSRGEYGGRGRRFSVVKIGGYRRNRGAHTFMLSEV